ncbi:hypothetical protein EGR_06010 [Echinococcus granulosus]|uniref:Uncharacterized protein n=1 Tax=Echinococcus granulosus TaxID=6210 RepID=W6ULV6_ECHGR|nr:hypothetical protein EGR_06010 [Echinococcus granulosus]EUB59147.1 hypothetical protein EGR_06010 [Echinococcus granulosus]
MDSRFRSPVVPRKVVGAEEAATSLAKKSKRSKSTENSLEKGDPFMRMAAKGKTDPEDPMSVLNKRWSVVAKNQETMSKQELLNNYRLLMNDHLRLERFLSIITKDNEMARNRLETDLLDAMMCIEDLKQALENSSSPHSKEDKKHPIHLRLHEKIGRIIGLFLLKYKNKWLTPQMVLLLPLSFNPTKFFFLKLHLNSSQNNCDLQVRLQNCHNCKNHEKEMQIHSEVMVTVLLIFSVLVLSGCEKTTCLFQKRNTLVGAKVCTLFSSQTD